MKNPKGWKLKYLTIGIFYELFCTFGGILWGMLKCAAIHWGNVEKIFYYVGGGGKKGEISSLFRSEKEYIVNTGWYHFHGYITTQQSQPHIGPYIGMFPIGIEYIQASVSTEKYGYYKYKVRVEQIQD